MDELLVKEIVLAYEAAYQLYLQGEGDDRGLPVMKQLVMMEVYASMDRARGWHKFANETTELIKFIIEFAKSIRNFTELRNDEQILLLKRSVFELAVIAMSMHFDLEKKTLTVDEVQLPIAAFKCEDAGDQAFGLELLHSIEALAAFRLNSAEVALLSAIVLMGDAQSEFVAKMREALYAKFVARFEERPVASFKQLWDEVDRLRDVSRQHTIALKRFEQTTAESLTEDLPPLYKECFLNEYV